MLGKIYKLKDNVARFWDTKDKSNCFKLANNQQSIVCGRCMGKFYLQRTETFKVNVSWYIKFLQRKSRCTNKTHDHFTYFTGRDTEAQKDLSGAPGLPANNWQSQDSNPLGLGAKSASLTIMLYQTCLLISRHNESSQKTGSWRWLQGGGNFNLICLEKKFEWQLLNSQLEKSVWSLWGILFSLASVFARRSSRGVFGASVIQLPK